MAKFKVGDRVRSTEEDSWTEGLYGVIFRADDLVYAVDFGGDYESGWSRNNDCADGPCWWVHEEDLEPAPQTSNGTRTFATGATRDTDENKLDFEGFLSPLVLEEFAKYMHQKRRMPDGSMRDSDNWQKGIPLDAYMKSMFRHFFAVWKAHRHGGAIDVREELLALIFNVQGYTHEMLKGAK